MKLFSPNSSLYKVMWAVDGTNIIWDMRQQEPDVTCAALFASLNKYFDVPAWVKSYEAYYHQWLETDDLPIYTLDAPLVASMLRAIRQFNRQEQHKLYYWFDIDRTEPSDFHWHRSPLSGEKLLELPGSFSSANRYIAPTDFLVFPEASAP